MQDDGTSDKQEQDETSTEDELQQADIKAADALMVSADIRLKHDWNYIAGERYEVAACIYLGIAETQDNPLMEVKAGHAYIKAGHAYHGAGTRQDAIKAGQVFHQAREHFNNVCEAEPDDSELAKEAIDMAKKAIEYAREAFIEGWGLDSTESLQNFEYLREAFIKVFSLDSNEPSNKQ